jgi:glycosyltransferase involved in cell wall biosynthesis
MSPLRVAIVTETWPPEVNGVAITLAQLAGALKHRGHDLRLVRPRQHRDDTAGYGSLRETLMPGLPVPFYPRLRMGVPCQRALRALWSESPPEIVHIATEGPLGWSALQAARRLGLPVSSDFRTNFHAYSAHYGAGLMRHAVLGYLRGFHNATACTMVPTENLRQELAGAGLQRLEVVGRGVDLGRFDPALRSGTLRRQWDASDDDLVVAHVGRLAPEKNLGAVADAFDAIRATEPRARLLVVGEGPARAQLAGRCAGASFAGSRHGAELAAHYASADLLLFPSRTETFGNVVIESMASGVPVVAFDAAAAGQIIEPGANGVLVSLDRPADYAPAAAAAVRERARLREMGRRARQTVAGLGWDAIAARVEGLWRELLHAHAGLTESASA